MKDVSEIDKHENLKEPDVSLGINVPTNTDRQRSTTVNNTKLISDLK